MLLNELFSQVVPWEWTRQNEYKYEAEFTVGKHTYNVAFRQTNMHDGDAKYTYEVDFSLLTERGDMIFNITKTGNAAVVMATVIDIIKNFRAKFPGSPLMFTAKEPSRRKMYNAIVRRLAPAAADKTVKSLDSDTNFYTIPAIT